MGLTLLYRSGWVLEFGYLSSAHNLGKHYAEHPLIGNLYQSPWAVALMLSPPLAWTVVLAVPKDLRSLHGSEEDAFWQNHIPNSVEVSKATSYAVLLKVVPGIIAADFEEVSDGMAEAYRESKMEEENIQGPETKALIRDLRTRYHFSGVSSLGPATYALVESPLTPNGLVELESRHDSFLFTTFQMAGNRSPNSVSGLHTECT